MTRYASNTSVSVANSKAEIERIVERYGADQFMRMTPLRAGEHDLEMARRARHDRA